LSIRAAIKKDLIRCEELFKLPEFFTPNGEYIKAKWLIEYLDESYFLVAEEEDKIIGALYGEVLKGKGVILWLLAVEQEYRKLGVGTAVLKQFENNAANNGSRWVILYSSTYSDKTLKFYKDICI